jgi:hypothetical protein
VGCPFRALQRVRRLHSPPPTLQRLSTARCARMARTLRQGCEALRRPSMASCRDRRSRTSCGPSWRSRATLVQATLNRRPSLGLYGPRRMSTTTSYGEHEPPARRQSGTRPCHSPRVRRAHKDGQVEPGDASFRGAEAERPAAGSIGEWETICAASIPRGRRLALMPYALPLSNPGIPAASTRSGVWRTSTPCDRPAYEVSGGIRTS